MKDNTTARPKQVELWMGQGGRIRMLTGDQVVFGKIGEVTKAFNIKTRREIDLGSLVSKGHACSLADSDSSEVLSDEALFLLQKLSSTSVFSLDTVILSLSGGELKDVTPLVTSLPVISEDMAVFDIQSKNAPMWLRIWALRESKLPTHIRMWNPRDGSCVDAIFSYSKEEPEVFFDPNVFAAKLKDPHNNETNLAYMFLKDLGGKQVSLRLDEHEAFKVVARTIDGQPWSLSHHRSKVVLVTFCPAGHLPYQTWHKQLYDRFGSRDDFVMVTVALDEKPESIKAKCEKAGIKLVHLYDPDHQMAQALATVDRDSMWLVWKDGTITEEPGGLLDTIEAALFGMTFNTRHVISERLRREINAGTLTKDIAKQICGIPDSTSREGKREKWEYRRLQESGKQVASLSIMFDEGGKAVSSTNMQSILDKAKITVEISPAFWHKHIPQLLAIPELPNQHPQFVLLCLETQGSVSFFNRYVWPNEITDQAYMAIASAGTYDLYLTFEYDKYHGKPARILLKKDVKLTKDEEETLRF